MKRDIIIRPQADADLDEQANYIAADSPTNGQRFYDAAENAFKNLAEMPGMGSQCHLFSSKLNQLRKWPIQGFKNHLIFYFEHKNSIEILRVLYGSRQWEILIEEEN